MGKRRKSRTVPARVARPVSPTLYYVLLAAVILFFGLIRFRLRDIPLERDEGEYAYAGQLILQGIPPYKLACNMKLPGTDAAYAAMMSIFGQTAAGIHIGMIVVVAASTVLIFLLGRRLFDSAAGIVAAASYALLATSPSVLGFAGHATHFIVLAALGGILLLLNAVRSRKKWSSFWSGTVLGLAFLMKQPGIFFALFAGLYLLIVEWRKKIGWRDFATLVGVFSFGAALPFGLTCLWLWRAGVFQRFWFWTFTYGRLYGTMVSLRDAPVMLWNNALPVIGPAVLIWIIAVVGFMTVLWDRKASDRFFLLGFLVFSFLAVCPGFYFREHYFIVILPAVSLLADAAVTGASQRLRGRSTLKWLRFASLPS